MLYIILLLVVGYFVFFKLLPWILDFFTDAFSNIFVLIFYYIVYGPANYLTKFALFIFDKIKIKWLAIISIYYGCFKFLLYMHPQKYENYKTSIYIITIVILVLVSLLFVIHSVKVLKQFRYRKVINYKEHNLSRCHCILCPALLLFEGAVIYQLSGIVFFFYFFAGSGIIYLGYGLEEGIRTYLYLKKFKKYAKNKSYYNVSGLMTNLHIPNNQNTYCENEVIKLVYNDKVDEIKLGGTNLFFNREYFNMTKKAISELFRQVSRIPKDVLFDALKSELSLVLADPLLEDFIKFYVNDVNLYEFDDGEYFLGDYHKDEIIQCACCGKAVLRNQYYKEEDEYYCSDLCRETEEICSKMMMMPKMIEAKDSAKFMNLGIDAGAAAWGTGQYWVEHAKMFGNKYQYKNGIAQYDSKTGKHIIVGPQGHGFAAEDANTIIDRLLFKNAKIVGDNNAKDGADRIVNGEFRQSKYCRTAESSVGKAFEGKVDGKTVEMNYRYIDSETGKPMPLEVPKDQYEKAIDIMADKIKKGKVPGVTDPKKATDLIRKGNITQQQAVNITKFGTVESLLYDSYHGMVIAASSASISFIASTAIYYWKTKDFKLAVRTSLYESAKTGGKAFAIYLIGAQVKKIPAVNTFLEKSIQINFTNSKTGKYVAQRLAGRNYKGEFVKGKSLNKKANVAIRGAVVTAATTVAVQSAIELITFARGRISGMQCVKNIAIGTAGVVSGTVGGLVGGVLFSPIPVVGPVLGSVVGGSVGGFLGGMGTKKIMDKFIKDDSEFILGLITKYVEYISLEFFLSEYEIGLLSDELDNYVSANKNIFKDVYAAKNRRAKINSFIKPMVINIVRHRDGIEASNFETKKIVKAVKAS